MSAGDTRPERPGAARASGVVEPQAGEPAPRPSHSSIRHALASSHQDQAPRASWPACSDAMFALARQLAAGGATQEEIRAALQAEFPGLPSENYYQNPAAVVVLERVKGRQREQERDQAHAEWRRKRGIPEREGERPPATPGIQPAPMSNKMRALAAAHEHRCAFCGRQGHEDGDPDGEAWHETRRAGGTGYALVCTGCLARPKGDDHKHAEV